MEKIRSHRDLDVYQMAFESAMRIFEISKSFPAEDKYSLTDPRRLSGLRKTRSRKDVPQYSFMSDTEAFRKRKYPKPGLFTKKFCCEQGEVEKVTEGYYWYPE